MPLSAPETNEAAGVGQSVYRELQSLTCDSETLKVINDVRMLFALGLESRGSLSSEAAHESAFCGGHVEVRDRRKHYNRWVALLRSGAVAGGSREGKSSHQSDAEQFEIALPSGWGCVLFGVRNGGSWFQIEAHAFTTGLYDWAAHGTDYLQHIASGGQQIGPRGRSNYSEKHHTALLVSSQVARDVLKLD